MTATTRFLLPEISASQAQKHVTHNEALIGLDAIVSAVAVAFLGAPLGTELDGAAYIVALGATGVFDGWDYSFAYLIDTVWVQVIPTDGMRVWVLSEHRLYVFETALAGWVPITRARPFSGATLYVDASGNDAHDGSMGSPFASISKAISVFNDYDCAGSAAMVQLLDGAYSEDVSVDRLPFGAASFAIQGNITTPGNVTGINFFASGDARLRIDGFETEGLNISDRALVDLAASNMSYVGSGLHISIADGAKVDLTAATEKIAGSPTYHLFAAGGGKISYQPSAVVLVGTPAFSGAYAAAYLNGLIYAPNWNSPSVVTGSATGKRHDADVLGVINTAGSDFPGDTPGTAVGGYFD